MKGVNIIEKNPKSDPANKYMLRPSFAETHNEINQAYPTMPSPLDVMVNQSNTDQKKPDGSNTNIFAKNYSYTASHSNSTSNNPFLNQNIYQNQSSKLNDTMLIDSPVNTGKDVSMLLTSERKNNSKKRIMQAIPEK